MEQAYCYNGPGSHWSGLPVRQSAFKQVEAYLQQARTQDDPYLQEAPGGGDWVTGEDPDSDPICRVKFILSVQNPCSFITIHHF